MYKLVELEKEEYESFVKPNKYKSHFLQSYAWGEFSKAKKNLIPYYLGLKKENKIVGTALLLQKKLPLGYSYFYSPRGFVLNYEDEETFNEFTKQVLSFTRNKKSIFLKIDPDIIRKRFNYLDEEQNNNYDFDKIFKMITKAGFKHLGFTKNFETMQPRYTFRIDLTQNIDDIKNHFSKTTKQRINKSLKLGTKVEIGTEKDLDTFCKLMMITEERKDFVSYSSDYYKTLYKMYNEDNKMTLFLGKIYPQEILNELNTRKTELNKIIEEIPKDNMSKSSKNKLKETTRQLESIENDITKYTKVLKDYGEEIILNAHMIIEYGDKAWVLYAGNETILTETYSNYHTYLTHLEYCKKEGYKIYDQFGTIGDLRKDNPRMGLHEFKKKFGGDYIEFIGEFDYVTKPFMYFVFTKLVPLYRNIVKKKSKKVITNEVNRTK
ncbi:MAG: peptidoglycan bridge formation glycyltransferase FemA/FemB family protein [Bacilli bacterium]|nr:peptidoglycan bridge formation glycyltransferase FemA/FemB family protein [Bacilli bacterium]